MTTIIAENPPRALKLVGGQLSLDFTNTVSWRGRKFPEDKLDCYQDLLDWSSLTGILDEDDARKLSCEEGIQPEAAKKVLQRAVELRESVYRIFTSYIFSEPASDNDLVTLNRELREALARLRLSTESGGYALDFGLSGTSFDQIIWPIVRSASEMLTSGDLNRVRRCAADDCGWLFLDTSRNRSRRWCDMKDCGNRSKVRRYYERRKGVEG
jgi:predicted RNA-binding Zn ribbon-like protein